MHKNHRRGFIASTPHGRQAHIKKPTKADAANRRRSYTRYVMNRILRGVLDPYRAIYLDRNVEVSDRWIYD